MRSGRVALLFTSAVLNARTEHDTREPRKYNPEGPKLFIAQRFAVVVALGGKRFFRVSQVVMARRGYSDLEGLNAVRRLDPVSRAARS